MSLDRRFLERMLDWAYMDWNWGRKDSAMKIINRIIEEVEGRGETPKQTNKSEARTARQATSREYKARRKDYLRFGDINGHLF